MRPPSSSSSQRSELLALHAAQMRSALTPSEQALWAELRSRKLGVLFKRQVVIAGFIVDFLAPAVRLIVEVDGGYHTRRRRADSRRDGKLRRLGYRVLRVQADAVMNALPDVLAAVLVEAKR